MTTVRDNTAIDPPRRSAICGGQPTSETVVDPDAQPQLNDEALTQAIATGHRPALEVLYVRHANTLMGIAYRILKNRSDAEDLLHDVCLEVWHKADSYDASRGHV